MRQFLHFLKRVGTVGAASIHKKVRDPVSADVQARLDKQFFFQQIAGIERSFLSKCRSGDQSVKQRCVRMNTRTLPS